MAESLSFERSDRTNQDEKITQEFEPCSGSIDLTRGQFVILGLKAKHDFLNGQAGPIRMRYSPKKC